MESIESLSGMGAASLAIMATRAQDQDLVASVADKHPLPTKHSFDFDSTVVSHGCNTSIVPSFGWHPWFSHLLYDDSAQSPTYQPPPDSEPDSEALLIKAKTCHYTSVLAPEPSQEFIASLPPPTPISSLLKSTRSYLEAYPLALVGEVGLDKAFRLPIPWDSSQHTDRDDALTPGGREGRHLSPHRVRIDHQRAVLSAQLRLAARTRRAVSVHGVQVHGVLHDTLAATWKGHEREVMSRRKRKLVAAGAEDSSDDEDDDGAEKPYPPRICLHSFSGGPEILKQYLHPAIPTRIFFSLSTAVNLTTKSSNNRTDEVLRALPDDRILVESDLHTAGADMDHALENIYRHVCQVKGWELEDGVKRIARNYQDFIFG